MATLIADNAYGTIASGLTTGDTTLAFTSGHGARFPAVVAPDVLYCCLLNAYNVLEEIKVTAHTANADSCTIVRAQGSTTAKAWTSGDRIEARLSATSVNGYIVDYVAATITATYVQNNSFEAGTVTVFKQTAAPLGWTKDTTAALNDTAMRIVTGSVSSGGSIPFSTVFARSATESHTLLTTEIPSHAHNISTVYELTGGAVTDVQSGVYAAGSTYLTGSTGGGGGHTHDMDIRVKYNDFIIAAKD